MGNILGERLKGRREKLKLSQGDLAAIIGTTQNQISRYERGENNPTADVLVSLAMALETSPNWLLAFEETPSIEG